jgi:hypothetical protein
MSKESNKEFKLDLTLTSNCNGDILKKKRKEKTALKIIPYL